MINITAMKHLKTLVFIGQMKILINCQNGQQYNFTNNEFNLIDKNKKMRINKLFLIPFIIVPLLILVTVISKLSFSEPFFKYSEGERIGVVRKFSKKGLKWKTYEGEMMLNAGMGTVKLDTFNFSVTREDIASQIKNNIGNNMNNRLFKKMNFKLFKKRTANKPPHTK